MAWQTEGYKDARRVMRRDDQTCLFGWGGEPRIPEDSLGLELGLDMDKDVRVCNLQVQPWSVRRQLYLCVVRTVSRGC